MPAMPHSMPNPTQDSVKQAGLRNVALAQQLLNMKLEAAIANPVAVPMSIHELRAATDAGSDAARIDRKLDVRG
jgi:hypothetical protein